MRTMHNGLWNGGESPPCHYANQPHLSPGKEAALLNQSSLSNAVNLRNFICRIFSFFPKLVVKLNHD